MDKKELVEQLIQTADIVREKYKSFRHDRNEEKIHLEKTFKPITKTLKEMSHNAKAEESEIFKEKYKTDSSSDDEYYSGKEDLNDLEKDNSSSESTYYLTLVANSSALLDKTYGIYYDDKTGNYKIGRSTFIAIGKNFQIDDQKFIETQGLLQLLFLKDPKNYTQNDLTAYEKILKTSCVYKRNFNPNGQTKGSKCNKYREIIKPLIIHVGGYLMNLRKQNIDYLYWNDPNELVDRLRLLISSQKAGNNNHNNEILSIIEELRESNIII